MKRFYPAKPQHSPLLDAIIVPTARSSEYLDFAAALARETASCLLVLCSQSASPSAAIARAIAADVPAVAVDFRPDYSHQLLRFRTDTFPQAAYGRSGNDLSVKRNLALLLSRLVGWQRVLFLDDDVRGPTKAQVAAVAAALATHPAAGFLVERFPDNSVVRHAERLSGIEPGVALCGGVLGVNTEVAESFFPNIYNEDWLFLFAARRRNSPLSLGSVQQLAYDPFLAPLRAATEEFGDVVAEGIAQLHTAGIRSNAASLADWASVLERRKLLIAEIRQRLAAQGQSVRARRALLAANDRLAAISARQCRDYVAMWHHDLATWRRRLQRLPVGCNIEQALQLLEAPYVANPPLRIGIPIGAPSSAGWPNEPLLPCHK